MSTEVQVHEHNSPRQTLLPHLLPHLPATIALVRRIQFHLQTPDVHVFVTFPPNTPPTLVPSTFTAVYVDRSRGPETEAFIFGTGEIRRGRYGDDDSSVLTAASDVAHEQIERQEREIKSLERLQLLYVLDAIANLPPTRLQTEDDQQPYDTNLLCVGALHTYNLALLQEDGSFSTTSASTDSTSAHPTEFPAPDSSSLRGVVHSHGIIYTKYLFPPASSISSSSTIATAASVSSLPLPDGLRWDTATSSDHALVLSRTNIPRRARTLKHLPAVAVRSANDQGEETLIAWAFLGVDASLASLHVEPPYRGNGLGKLVTRAAFGLLREAEPGSGADKAFSGVTEGSEWCHSDVGKENVESVAVAQGLGGKEGWDVAWTWVDLGKVREVVRGLKAE